MAVLQELYDAGLSHLLIAEALGIDKGAVSAKLARLGWRRGETTTSARRSSAGPVHNRTPQPIKRRTVFSGQALQVGGNRADLLLRDVLACIDKRMGRK